jgi:hypothetical protein
MSWLGKGPVNDYSWGILSKYVDRELKFIRSNMISLGKGPVNDYSRGIWSNYVDRESRFILVVTWFRLARDQWMITHEVSCQHMLIVNQGLYS